MKKLMKKFRWKYEQQLSLKAKLSIPVVRRELSSLDVTKGAGPHDILPQMVRWLADFLAEPLSKLFANALSTAVVPTDWRLAIICPIHKKRGSRGRFQLPPRESHFYNM